MSNIFTFPALSHEKNIFFLFLKYTPFGPLHDPNLDQPVNLCKFNVQRMLPSKFGSKVLEKKLFKEKVYTQTTNRLIVITIACMSLVKLRVYCTVSNQSNIIVITWVSSFMAFWNISHSSSILSLYSTFLTCN